MHIYRWDLDKTYLDTDIDSMRGLVRSAVESASEKTNVPGSAALMRSLTHHDARSRIVILSGSPTQMRDVLEEKLALDGVRFDQLVLKDNLRNLRRGRFRAVRNQVGYKLPNLLKMRVGAGREVTETLFGDDSEVDALIYCLYAQAVAGKVDERELARIMEASGAYRDHVKDAVRALRNIADHDAVEDIFIHVGRGVPLKDFARLGPKVTPVFSWFQAASILWRRGRVGADGVESVVKSVDARLARNDRAFAAWLQDLVRRGLLSREDVVELVGAVGALKSATPMVMEALEWLGEPEPQRPWEGTPDYLGFFRAVHGD